MNLQSIKKQFIEADIFHSDCSMMNRPSVIAYEKKFNWLWMATQLNTFIVVTDFGDEEVTESMIERHLEESFGYAKEHYKGWPRGLQSGTGVVGVLVSSKVTEEAKEYCRTLKSGNNWAGFMIPVVHDTQAGKTAVFDKNPIWGLIYYPHFKRLINGLKF